MAAPVSNDALPEVGDTVIVSVPSDQIHLFLAPTPHPELAIGAAEDPPRARC